MSAPAYTADSKSDSTETSRPNDSWYSAFATTDDGTKDQPAGTPEPSNEAPILDPLDTLTLSDIPGPHARAGADGATLPALVRFQQAELERLAQDNEQLMGRIETLLQIQGREQVLRQQLQNQVDRIAEQKEFSPPTETLEAVRREARAGVTEEIKPVLMAILDALERFSDKQESAPVSVEIAEIAEPADPLMNESFMGDPFKGEEYGKLPLPLILTRPLGELMEDVSDPERSNKMASQHRPRKSLFHNKKRTRSHVNIDREDTGGPASSTWTTVFSS